MANAGRLPYHEAFEDLHGVCLEDSWVLDADARGDIVAGLTPEHPDYTGPREGEQHDYRRATLTVSGVKWFERSTKADRRHAKFQRSRHSMRRPTMSTTVARHRAGRAPRSGGK